MPFSYKIKSSKDTKTNTPVDQNSTKSPRKNIKKGNQTRIGNTAVMVDSRHPNTSVITTKADQLITVTTQAGVTTQDRKLRLGITSSPDGPH